MTEDLHVGRNLRHLRLLKGMKQVVFAKKLGIAQQNVSKMENKKEISIEKLEEAAKALGITVDAIKGFNEKVYLNNNIALEENTGQIVHPIKELLEYFKEELLKKDNKIEEKDEKIAELTSELEKYRSGKKMPSAAKKSEKGTELKSVPLTQNRKATK